MSEVTVIIRTADQTRKAEITMARTSVGGDIIQAAVDNWALPSDTDYTRVNTSSGKAMSPSQSLSDDLVQDGQVLEVQPVLVAGC